MLTSKKPTRAPQTGLNLIAKQEHMMCPANARDVGKIARWRHIDATFPLNRFDQEGRGVWGDCSLERECVAERNELEAGREWPKAIAILRNRGKAGDCDRPTVKISLRCNNLGSIEWHALDLIGPLARCLERGLYRFSPAIHRQSEFHAGQGASSGKEGAQSITEIGAGYRVQPLGLLGECLNKTRMAMAEARRRVGSHHINVASFVLIPNIDAIPADDRYRQRRVVRCPVAGFKKSWAGHDTLLRIQAKKNLASAARCAGL